MTLTYLPKLIGAGNHFGCHGRMDAVNVSDLYAELF
jgi:hypothetical protein